MCNVIGGHINRPPAEPADEAVSTSRLRRIPWYFEQRSPLAESFCRRGLAREKIVVLMVRRVSHFEAGCDNRGSKTKWL